ncbi:MAG TPA: HAD family hydrolase [Candidatus Saccharimonadia bacterium]|nr:HAD family hydrolase [Candidatus Saccharimonadia bacterium]
MPERALMLPDLRTPRAILFDLDGTLVDTVGLRIEGWLAAFAEMSIDADAQRVGGLVGADGKRLARDVATAAAATMSEDEIAAIDRRAGDLFSDLNIDPRPLPGARALLAALLVSGFPFVIATSSLGAQVTASLDALDLPGRPPIVDGEHVEHAKPAPDLLLLAAERAGVAPTACWYVGDATWDFLACVAADMSGIAVPTGAVDGSALLGAGALVVIDGLDDLTDELRRRGLLDP